MCSIFLSGYNFQAFLGISQAFRSCLPSLLRNARSVLASFKELTQFQDGRQYTAVLYRDYYAVYKFLKLIMHTWSCVWSNWSCMCIQRGPWIHQNQSTVKMVKLQNGIMHHGSGSWCTGFLHCVKVLCGLDYLDLLYIFETCNTHLILFQFNSQYKTNKVKRQEKVGQMQVIHLGGGVYGNLNNEGEARGV